MQRYEYLRKNCKNEFLRQKITYERFQNTHNVFFDFLQEHILFSKKTRVLEIGCGGGFLLNDINKKWGSYVEGWDLNDEYLNKGRERFKNVSFRKIGFFEDIKVKEKFDVIIFRETLMVLKNPHNLLGWAKHFLKASGAVGALEPDYSSTVFYPESDKWTDFYKKYSKYCFLKGNENFAMGRSLGEVFVKAGMKNIKVKPIIEFNSWLNAPKMKRFLDIEIFSIKVDVPLFIKETGYPLSNLKKALNFLKSLHTKKGSYLQTNMTAAIGYK